MNNKLGLQVAKAAAIGIASVLFLTACGSVDGTQSIDAEAERPSRGESSDAVRDLLPKRILNAGELRIGTNGGYPPFEFYDTDNTTVIGADIDLITAVAGLMGVEPVITIGPFAEHITSLKANKQDVVIASIGITEERMKEVDFVSYFEGGTSLLVPAGNPQSLALDNLCGAVVGVGAGTIYQSTYLPEWDAECAAAGEDPIEVSVFKGNNDATLALTAGQVDAVISDYAPLTYTAKNSGGSMEVLSQQYKPIPWGIAMNKDSELAEAVQLAVQELIDDGTYGQILAEWGIEAGAISTSSVNPGS